MGLFDSISDALGNIVAQATPIVSEALGARLGEKLGPRQPSRSFPTPGGFPPGSLSPVQVQAAPLVLGAANQVFDPRFGVATMPPAGFQQASLITQLPRIGGAVLRQLPGLGAGVIAGEAIDAFTAGGGVMTARRMPGQIAVNSFFHATPSGRVMPNRVSFVEDGQGSGGFFVNAGRPTAWSKVTLKKPRRCHPR